MNENTIEEDIARLALLKDGEFLTELAVIRSNKGDSLTTDARWICFVKNELETRIGIQRLSSMI